MYKKLKLVERALEEEKDNIISNTNLTEAPDEEGLEKISDDTEEMIDNQEEIEDTIDSEEDQEENPVEEESELDKQLDELRDVLVDLDLNLYQITSKEDKNNPIYIIGKVAEDSDDTLMLVDTKPEEVNSEDLSDEEPIIDNIDIDDKDLNEAEGGKIKANRKFIEDLIKDGALDDIDTLNKEGGFDRAVDYWVNHYFDDHSDKEIEDMKANKDTRLAESSEDLDTEEPSEEDNKTELEERFDFVKLPLKFEEINQLNPRYGNELTPDHEAIMEYLMNCLIEINPEAAEELQNSEDISDEESIEDIDLDIDIDREEEEDED